MVFVLNCFLFYLLLLTLIVLLFFFMLQMVVPIILHPEDQEEPNVGLEAIQDNVVSDQTRQSYLSEWIKVNHNFWGSHPEVFLLNEAI
jgi:hypothetical protein